MQITGTKTPNYLEPTQLGYRRTVRSGKIYVRFNAPNSLLKPANKHMQMENLLITMQQSYDGDYKKPQLDYAIGLARTIMVTWAQ